AMCCAFFFRRQMFERLSGYDIYMGHGTNSWGKEDTDILLRAVEAGMCVQYVPDLVVQHPQIFAGGTFDEDKLLGYAMGDGLMLGRHPMPLWWKGLFYGMPMLRYAWAALRRDRAGMRRSRLEVKGRYLGHFHPNRCTRALRPAG
ncbi:MAG TPA: galactosyltransferase-related protein, partial [Tepidisphaeraceae bacterium]|nr:galactosyltransferase-related protein [Tepidisphaeraceae bacterium]